MNPILTNLQITQVVIARLQGRSWEFIAASNRYPIGEFVYDGPQLRRIVKKKLFPTRQQQRRGK